MTDLNNMSDPICPTCDSVALARHTFTPDGDLLFWCNHCGTCIDVTFVGTRVDKIEVHRPTVHALDLVKHCRALVNSVRTKYNVPDTTPLSCEHMRAIEEALTANGL